MNERNSTLNDVLGDMAIPTTIAPRVDRGWAACALRLGRQVPCTIIGPQIDRSGAASVTITTFPKNASPVPQVLVAPTIRDLVQLVEAHYGVPR